MSFISSFISKNLSLPYIAPAQDQKHVTHNEALRALDAIVHLSFVSKSQTTPPAGSSEGARYFVAGAGTDEWAGQDGKIAAYQDGSWAFYTPVTGWRAWIEGESTLQVWDGTAWQNVAADTNHQNLEHVGINATADITNRLAVSSPSTLFTHAGNGHQLKLNKNTVTDTASTLYQTNFSGRAEVGLSGDDNFHFKVSPNGSTFFDGIVINKNNGTIILENGIVHKPTGKIVSTYIPSSVREIWRLDMNRPATPRTYTISSVGSNTINLTAPDVPAIYTSGMRNNAMIRLWNITKSPPENCWINYNNSNVQINVFNPSSITGWSAGDILQLGDPSGEPDSGLNTLGMVAIDISNYLFNILGAIFRQTALNCVIRAQASGGAGRVGLSADGSRGSAFDGYSMSTGAASNATFIVPCTELSPISNSNLLYLREPLEAGATHHNITFVRILGVYVQ